MNFAENLLRFRDDRPALVFRREDKLERTLSYKDLFSLVAQTSSALKSAGITSGDRVAGFIPNIPEAVIAMLATASISIAPRTHWLEIIRSETTVNTVYLLFLVTAAKVRQISPLTRTSLAQISHQ